MAPVRRNATSLPAAPAAVEPDTILSRAVAMWAAGSLAKEIVAALGLTTGKLSGMINRNRELFPVRDPSAVATATAARRRTKGRETLDEQIAKAAALWAEGKSHAEIAKALSVTKGVVSGWTTKDRKRFPMRGPARKTALVGGEAPTAPPTVAAGFTPAVAGPIVSAQDEPAQTGDGQVNHEGGIEALDERPARADAFRPLRGAEPVALVNALATSCRWPVYPAGTRETGAAHHCCGRATGDLKHPYCDVHTRMGTSRVVLGPSPRVTARRGLLASGAGKPLFAAQAAGA